MDLAVPQFTAGRAEVALEAMRFALQRGFHEGPVLCEELFAEQIADVGAAQLVRALAEPRDVGLVGEAVAEVAVPVADHARDAVQDVLQPVLMFEERRRALGHALLQRRVQRGQGEFRLAACRDVEHDAGVEGACWVVGWIAA